MPSRRPLLSVAVAAAVLALGWMGTRAWAFLDRATGYAAKVAGSAVFVAGRTLADVAGDELSVLDWIELTRTPRGVEAAVLGVHRSAVWRPGLGVTLLDAPDTTLLPGSGPERGPASTSPAVVAPPVALAAVLDAWFDGDEAAQRRTRAVVIRHHGRVVAERYATGYGPDSVLPGWSMTKSVTGVLVGILVRQGRLDIFAPAGVPEWSAEGDPRGAITVDQLLRMSAGLEFSEEYDHADADAVKMLFGVSDTGAFAAALPLAEAPDTAFHYSSGTTNILARLIRGRFDGSTLRCQQFVRDELFDPLGMDRAVLELDPSGTFVGSSFGHATARGWARFGQLYLDDGLVLDGGLVFDGGSRRVLPEGWVAYSVTPTPTAPFGQYGAHVWLNVGPPGRPEERPLPDVPPDTLMARGYAGQLLAVVPSARVVILRLAVDAPEASFSRNAFLADVLAALPDGSGPAPAQAQAPPASADRVSSPGGR